MESIKLDPKTYEAVVTLRIDNGYQFTKDTIASILTSGLLGEVYIGLDAGGDPQMLADGGRITKTQSAVVLEKLIGQFLFDKATSGARQMTKNVRVVAALAAARSCCRAAPARPAALDDPFEAVQPRDVRDQRAARRVHREAGRAGLYDHRAELHAHAPSATTSTTSTTCSRSSTTRCRASGTRWATTWARVMINTGFGFAGLIDIAIEAGIPRGDEDFGQTFGYWGIPQGPYLFIPLWGPTTVRDGTGSILRLLWSPTNEIPDVPVRNVIYGLVTVERDAQASSTR